MNPGGSEVTQLTSNSGIEDRFASWSADGTRIAIGSNRDGDNEVYVMNADGTNLANLTNNSASEAPSGWSPDGTKIVFTSDRDGNAEVYVMNADGTGQTNLTNNPAYEDEGVWSADGTKIAFSSYRDGHSQVCLMNADGTNQTNCSNNPAHDGSPDWSPDGTKIAFASLRDNPTQAEIYVMNADCSGQTNRSNNFPIADSWPAWSPDGTKIAFISNQGPNPFPTEVFVMNADGTGQTRLTNNSASDFTPDWQPVVVTKRPRLANLWLCDTGAAACDNKASGVEEVNLDVELSGPVTSPDPKCAGFPNFQDPNTCPRQTIGAFEFEVRYDAKLVSVVVEPGGLFADRREVECASTPGEGFVQFRCVTKGKERVVYGPGTLARVRVTPTADVYSILIPNQLNGIATQLINQDCQLADLQGHPIDIDACDDAAITIRYLEGDVHADCAVDVHDQQQIAFRWGSRLGSLLYNDRYDLEPSAPKKGDGDIDAKDLQLVYGRHGSTCKRPHPPHPPVDPKAKLEPPATG